MSRILLDLPELAEMNRIIAECLSTPNRMMNDIVTRYLKVKGKQIRPVLVILSAKMFGKVSDKKVLLCRRRPPDAS